MHVTKIPDKSHQVKVSIKNVEEKESDKEIIFTIGLTGDYELSAKLLRTMIGNLEGEFALSENEA